ncbi:laminin subunit beta-1 [Striga asiatica]|uniref:Laminin subunit beta-1 n=1 Tax=Striga asiatica TaxID=4170 RepID=A0A5A7R0C8_STRAF|nr:laminin subunit beta-1 [Striga asiatica]
MAGFAIAKDMISQMESVDFTSYLFKAFLACWFFQLIIGIWARDADNTIQFDGSDLPKFSEFGNETQVANLTSDYLQYALMISRSMILLYSRPCSIAVVWIKTLAQAKLSVETGEKSTEADMLATEALKSAEGAAEDVKVLAASVTKKQATLIEEIEKAASVASKAVEKAKASVETAEISNKATQNSNTSSKTAAETGKNLPEGMRKRNPRPCSRKFPANQVNLRCGGGGFLFRIPSGRFLPVSAAALAFSTSLLTADAAFSISSIKVACFSAEAAKTLTFSVAPSTDFRASAASISASVDFSPVSTESLACSRSDGYCSSVIRLNGLLPSRRRRPRSQLSPRLLRVVDLRAVIAASIVSPPVALNAHAATLRAFLTGWSTWASTF